MHKRQPQMTAVILAGGMGRRMGGKDKGLVELQGRPLVAHVIEAVAPQVSHLLINANRNQPVYARFGPPVLSDELEGFQGPLAGILTAMKKAPTPLLLVVPCDAPRPPADLGARLQRAMADADAEIAVAHDGDRLQPVHALIATALADDLESYLGSGKRKIDHWYARHRMVVVDFSDQPEAFVNINTPDERNALEGGGPDR